MTASEREPFHTVRELAQAWNVSLKKVYRLIARGDLQAVRIGRELRVPDTAKRGFERRHKVR